MEPQQTPQQSLDISSLLVPIIELVMMIGFMKLMYKFMPEYVGREGQSTSAGTSTATRKPIPSPFGKLVDNQDRDDRQYAYQQLELESLAPSLENRIVGVAVEAAGDICRELLGKQYADGAYISEKLTKVKNAANDIGFKKPLSAHDNDVVTKAINGYAELEFKTYFGVQAKALVMSTLRQDKASIPNQVKSMEEQMKVDERFKK